MNKIKILAREFDGITPVDQRPPLQLVDGWRQAIATMLASPPPPEHLAAFAERIGDRFSEARMIGRYIELFRRLCPHPRAA